MTVSVYTRHSTDCPKREDRYWKRCDCPQWLQYQVNGHQVKESAKTRSWEQANKKARRKEAELEAAERGESVPTPASHITVSDAVKKYLSAKRTEGVGVSAMRKQTCMTKRLEDWCNSRNVLFLKDVLASDLSDWRNDWTFKKYEDGSPSYSWKIHWSIIKGLFTHAQTMGWTPSNEAAKLKGFKVRHEQVQPFTAKEMSTILDEVGKCGWNAEQTHRIKAFILLMRWSGLACRDSATLERAALDDKNRIHTRRTKTHTAVFVSLPPTVADYLRKVVGTNSTYFFWNGTCSKDTLVAEFQAKLHKVFETAGVAGHSHQFRHTFAVELLIAGTPLEDVSKLLGHKSIAVTEKHYSAWVQERQTKLEGRVQDALQKMEIPAF